MQNSQWTYEQSNGSSDGTVIVLVCLGVLGITKHKNQKHLLGQNFALIVKAQLSTSEIVKEGLDKRKAKRGGKKVSEIMSPYLIPYPETNIKEEKNNNNNKKKKTSLEFGGFNLSKKERKKEILLKKKKLKKKSQPIFI